MQVSKLRNARLFAFMAAGFVALNYITYRIVRQNIDAKPLTSSPEEINLGNVVEGTIVHRSVPIKNASMHSLSIVGVETSCGCTTASSVEGAQIAPGQTTPLSISFDSTKQFGKINKFVQVQAEGYPDKPLIIHIEGEVPFTYAAEPPEIPLGSLKINNTKPIEFTITRVDGEPLHTRSVDSPHAGNWGISRIDNASRAKFTGLFRAPNEPGDHTDMIRVHMWDTPQSIFSLPISYTVIGDYEVSPSEINLGPVQGGAPRIALVRITGNGADILRLISAPKFATVRFVSRSAQDCCLQVMYAAKGNKGTWTTGEIVLSTPSRNQPRVIIPFFAAIS